MCICVYMLLTLNYGPRVLFAILFAILILTHIEKANLG